MGRGNFFNKVIKAMGCIAVVAWANPSFAQYDEGDYTPPKPIGPRIVKTSYSLNGTATDVTTVVTGDKKGDDKLLTEYIFPKLKGALEKSAFVTKVSQTKGEEKKEKITYNQSEKHLRNTHAFVTFNVSAPITLLLNLEEEYYTCPKDASDYCYESKVVVKGPFAIYGNFASSINVDSLMREKQQLTFAVKRSGDELKLVSTFQINSHLFDESLARMFQIFNLPYFTEGGEIGPAGDALAVAPLSSRQRLLLGVSRMIRQLNERIIKP